MKVKKTDNTSGLPKIAILNNLKKKAKVAKTDNSNVNVVDFQVLPWTSAPEWDNSCQLFCSDTWEELLERLMVWQARLPTLPVGAEGTLFLLQAMSFTLKCDPFNPIENLQARTLYSLALIRFVNHVSHLATQAMGGVGRPMFQLASHMNIPTWIVDLRHEVTHGGNLPTLEVLQSAGGVMKTWLQENYWIPTGSEKSPVELLSLPEPGILDEDFEDTESDGDESGELVQTVSEVISAYVASRVYHLRQATTIADIDVTKFWSSKRRSITTKEALRGLKHTINLCLAKNPELTCSVLAAELIPLPDFYTEFCSIFIQKPMAKLQILWKPLLKMLQRKNQLFQLCAELAKIHTQTDSNFPNSEYSCRWSAIWIKRILILLESQGPNYSEPLLRNILPIVLKSPNSFSRLFLKRLLRLIKPRVCGGLTRKMLELGEIWAEPLDFDVETLGIKKLITLEEIVGEIPSSNPGIQSTKVLDERTTEFWQNIPLGHTF